MRGSYKSLKGINLTVLGKKKKNCTSLSWGGAWGGGGACGAAQSVRGNYTLFEGINVTVLERMHQFIMYILGKAVQSVAIIY